MPNPSPVVLKNKGVPVDIAKLKADKIHDEESGEDYVEYEVDATKDGEPKTEKFWVRFDMNALAAVEEEWGDLQTFQEAIGTRQNLTIRNLFAILFDPENPNRHLAGMRLIPEKMGDYATAVGVALSIANGVDPTRAAKVLEIGVKMTADAAEQRNAAIDEAVEMAAKASEASTGTTSAANGSGLEEPSPTPTPSGD